MYSRKEKHYVSNTVTKRDRRTAQCIGKNHRTNKNILCKGSNFKHLDDLEDIYLAEKRLEDVRAGKSKTIPLEKVMANHGLEN